MTVMREKGGKNAWPMFVVNYCLDCENLGASNVLTWLQNSPSLCAFIFLTLLQTQELIHYTYL